MRCTHSEGQPFNSALLELSTSSRRWKLEASRVLASEVRQLEAQVAALVAQIDRSEAQAGAALRACEERAATERDILRRALRDAEVRAQYFEERLHAALDAASSGQPPPPPPAT